MSKVTGYNSFFCSYKSRYSIFKVHLKPLKTDLNLDTVARKMAALTPGFTGKHFPRFDYKTVKVGTCQATSYSNMSCPSDRSLLVYIQVGWLSGANVAVAHRSNKLLRVYRRIFVEIFVFAAYFCHHNKSCKFCLIWYFAATKFYCRDHDFHKNFPVNTWSDLLLRHVAATCSDL